MSTNEQEPCDVGIVVVGMNAREFVRGCLASIAEAGWRNVTYRTVYVDNASSDGSVEMVQGSFPDTIVQANPTNVGYCPAANQGARLVDCRHYYFINDDTVVLDDAIALLVEYMDAHPDVGTAGSRLLYPDGTEQWSGRRFPTMMNAVLGRRSLLTRLFPKSKPVSDYLCKDELERGEPFDVDWVSAAGQIVRREVFDGVGGYAEDYYYWHEAVLCDRILAAGSRVVLHPGSRVVHYEGKGSGPRPFAAQRFHIIDFHRGAWRCYCQHYRLGALHPFRWLAAAGLTSRAILLLAGSRLKTLRSTT